MPEAPSEDEVLTWFEQLSNWDRWGPDDRLGTLNHITPAHRVAAAGLVREGVSVSCSWDVRTGPQPGATVENQRYMLSTGLGLADEGRRNMMGEGRAGGAQEFIGMVLPRPRRHPSRLARPHLLGWPPVRRRPGVDGVGPPRRARARRARGVRRGDDPRCPARHRPSARGRRARRGRPRLPGGPRGGGGGGRDPRRPRRRRAHAHRRERRPAGRPPRVRRLQAAVGLPGGVPPLAPRAGCGDAGVGRRPGPDAVGLPHRCTCRSTWSASSPWASGSSTTASSRTSPQPASASTAGSSSSCSPRSGSRGSRAAR